MVLRYLEAGDTVVAAIKKPCPELEEHEKQYGDKLIIAAMDISSTASMLAAAEAVSKKLSHIDLLINNAVSVSPDCDKGFFDADLDYIARTVDITAVGAMPDNPAPLSSYEAAEILRELFEKKRNDFDSHRFITNMDEDYPF